ncbi:MAG: GAF domain-containing protein [Anaerolineae bacterium]
MQTADPKYITRVLYIILTIAGMISVGLLVNGLISHGVYSASAAAIGLAVVLFLLAMIRRGRLNYPRVLLPPFVFILATALVVFNLGIRDEAMLLFPVCMALSGLLLGRRAMLLATLLSSLVVLGSAFADMNGWHHSVTSSTVDVSSTLFVLGFMVLLAALIFVIIDGLTNSLMMARTNGRELAESNRELQAIRASLEEQVAERTRRAEAARGEAEAARRALEVQMWQTTGQVQLSEALRGEQDLHTLAANALHMLCPYLQLPSATLFLLDGDVLRRVASYAGVEQGADSFKLGEGLVGQAALDKRPILLSPVPTGVLRIRSALGESAPCQVLVQPILNGDAPVGVLEVAAFQPLSAQERQFLQQVEGTLASALLTAAARQRVNELLEQTQRQTQELQAQEEELRAINEELHAQAESLHLSRPLA